MAVRSTQPLTFYEHQEYFLLAAGGGGAVWGGRYMELTTLQLSCANCLEIWKPQLSGTLWDCNGPVDWLLIPVFLKR
jgi:hypothetical protein